MSAAPRRRLCPCVGALAASAGAPQWYPLLWLSSVIPRLWLTLARRLQAYIATYLARVSRTHGHVRVRFPYPRYCTLLWSNECWGYDNTSLYGQFPSGLEVFHET